ncbi:MAG: hypothetical protein J6Q82_00295 [Clostridia bacterium]|nr:hypothetical protein [Clostridia bacterium]
MNQKKFNSRAPRYALFSGFGGISTNASTDSKSATSIVNFRVRKDGALEKRCGACCLFDLEEKIRALWSGTIHSHYSAYFLAGTAVYRSDLSEESFTKIGTVASAEGDANFFCLQGQLYLTDGKNVYRIGENSISPAVGYVPLLGKDWDNDRMGEICEPLNLMNRHARITYIVSSTSSIFVRYPKPIASVEAFYRNGVLLSPDDYEINNGLCALEIFGLEKNDTLELFLTFEEDEESPLSIFCSTKDAVFFGAGAKSRTFFFGSEGSDMMFCTSYVTPDSLTESRRYYDADPLYLPEGYEFQIGDGTSPIRGAIRHYDSLLIFTEKDTWSANADSTGLSPLPALPVNAELGCVSSHGCVLSPNDPITLSRHGLYRWQSRDPETSPRDAIRIPSPTDGDLNLDDLRQSALFYDALANELWWSIPSRGEVWINSPENGEWFCFTGFSAERMFDADGKVGFIHGSCVFKMDSTLTYDTDRNHLAKKISAHYESVPLTFESTKPKNLSGVHTICDLDGATLCVELCEDNERSVKCELSDPEHPKGSVLSYRLRSGRFRCATLRLSSEDSAHLVIHAMMLVAH